MRIPNSWLDKHGNYSAFYERLDAPQVTEIDIGDHRLTLLYETPREGFCYGCSPSDVARILASSSDLAPTLPDVVAFRQPTRKQKQQNPVWGRFVYFSEFKEHEGTAIVLEAQELGSALKWPKRMTLEDRIEYQRLVQDGHVFIEDKRHFVAELTETGVRNTILYRTLLHELGHLADYVQKVLIASMMLDPDSEVASELFFARPPSEREAFANRFAEELRQNLVRDGEIPFEPEPFPVDSFP